MHQLQLILLIYNFIMDLFKILFNLGDNYYQSLPEPIWIKLITTVIPIFLSSLLSFYIAQYMFKKQNEKKDIDENKRLSELKDYICYCLLRIVEVINGYNTFLNMRIAELKKDIVPETLYTLHRPLEIPIGLNLSQIEKLSVDDTFKILVTDNLKDQQNIKNYQLLMAFDEQLTKITRELEKLNTFSSDDYARNRDLILKYLDEINDVVKDLSAEYINNQVNEPHRKFFVESILSFWKKYFDENKGYLENINDILVKDIKEFFNDSDNAENYHDFKESKILLNACQKIGNSMDDIIQSKRIQIENLSNWLNDLRIVKKVIENILNRIYPNKLSK
jgi:hypothetical protein